MKGRAGEMEATDEDAQGTTMHRSQAQIQGRQRNVRKNLRREQKGEKKMELAARTCGRGGDAQTQYAPDMEYGAGKRGT